MSSPLPPEQSSEDARPTPSDRERDTQDWQVEIVPLNTPDASERLAHAIDLILKAAKRARR
jgi:hypothetical protein